MPGKQSRGCHNSWEGNEEVVRGVLQLRQEKGCLPGSLFPVFIFRDSWIFPICGGPFF